jgi:hypothetical protein
LNEGPRRRVPEEGKGPGGAEHRLKLRGLFSQERSSLGPRSSRLGRMEPDLSSTGSGAPSQLNVDEGSMAVGGDIWALSRILGFAFREASQTGSPN